MKSITFQRLFLIFVTFVVARSFGPLVAAEGRARFIRGFMCAEGDIPIFVASMPQKLRQSLGQDDFLCG